MVIEKKLYEKGIEDGKKDAKEGYISKLILSLEDNYARGYARGVYLQKLEEIRRSAFTC